MSKTRKHRGAMNEAAGRAAEDQVAAFYAARGLRPLATRWRGKAGEIDLVFRDGMVVVFVEVKQSASHDTAAANLSPRQQDRILAAAEEYLGTLDGGLLTEMRVDVALIDGRGFLKVIEGALGV